MIKPEVLKQILELVQQLEMPERGWLLSRLSEVECNPDYREPAEKSLHPTKLMADEQD